ncbi:MAG: competence/damage-inducible protein A, partial [Moorea sp. SIO3I7]|nr:competence/damage-inducible protein A [Moorena sp. SIO3I7]
MSAEIICVGTELLLGDILNSNAQFLAQELAALGIPHYYQTVVGDNIGRLQQVLAIASERSTIL